MVGVVGVFVGVNGESGDMDPAVSANWPVDGGRRPTWDDLGAAIDAFLGERAASLVETTDLAEHISRLLTRATTAVGRLMHDPGLESADSIPHASDAARRLVMGGKPDDVLRIAGSLVEFVRGEHIGVPLRWRGSPLALALAATGLIELPPPAEGDPLSASVVAAMLQEEGPGAIRQLIDDGALREHSKSGVDSRSVIELVIARMRAQADGASRDDV